MADRLLVDLGNSRLKWARADAPGAMEAADWRQTGLPDLLDRHWSALPRPDAVAAACVAPEAVRRQLADWVAARWGVEVFFVSAERGWPGLACGYRQPARLGADRWAAVVAAHHAWPEGSLVVDCGTAITLDAVAPGRHLGGCILPGVAAMRQALAGATGLEVDGPVPAPGNWGTDTREAVYLGTAGAVVALVEQALERLQAAGVCDPTLVLTGGQAGFIEPLMQVDYRRHDALVLEGVRLCSGRDSQ